MTSDQQHHHKPFSPRLAFLLTNPLRRYREPPNRLVDIFKINSSDTVVDFGCGPGYYTVEIARRAARTIGVDISDEMLEKARRAAEKAGVSIELLRSDGTSIELPASSISLILLIHVYHEIPDKEKTITEFRRILLKGGRIIIEERTRQGMLAKIVPGPPVFDVSRITELALKVGLTPGDVTVNPHRSQMSLVTLQKQVE